MKCSEIMNRNLELLFEHDTIVKAAHVMAETGVGFLPICDGHKRPIGVVTDRDLTVRALAKKVPAETTTAAMVMTSPVLTCLETTDLRDAEELMKNEQKGRLVITDAEGRVVGVLSLADIVEHAPARQVLDTIRAVLWREALGPRGGAARGQPLLQDDPVARKQPIPDDDGKARDTVFTGGHYDTGTKEFPG